MPVRSFWPRLTALSTVAALGLGSAPPADARDQRGRLDFQGRFIVSVSDADMLASAYVNGALGPREGRDALSIIPLQGDPRDWKAVEIEAPNSVAGPPAAVDVTPDGRFAIVIETWTQRPEGGDAAGQTFQDLKHGNRVTVFDLSDPAAPKRTQTLTTLERPDAVRVSPDGRAVAISYHPEGAGAETPLRLYRFEGGALSAPRTPSIAGWPAGDRLIDLDWHPTEPILALLNGSRGAIHFARVSQSDGAVAVFGNPVRTERAPYRLFFTPDGRHVVSNALYWGPDIAGRWIEAPRGSIVTVRMNAERRPDGTVRHALIGRVATGVSPEGLAVSPDGRWVATTNLERSYLPYDDPRITFFSSITLARLDPESGALIKMGDFAYDGILPEAAVFDNSSRYLAVANFDHFDDRKTGGSIDFWRIAIDPLDPTNAHLVKTEHSTPVTRGAHSMAIVR